MVLITKIKPREYAGEQPFRDWHCTHYNKCLDQAARVNGFINCTGCGQFEPKENPEFHDQDIKSDKD